MPAGIASGIIDKIKNDDPLGARMLLDGIDATLSDAARAEWRQRVAWSFYIENQDTDAYALAQLATQGAGPWVGEAWWTAGLAAWRLGDCQGAADAFRNTASRADNPELQSAAGRSCAAASPSKPPRRCASPPRATKRSTACSPPSSWA
jgi:hypothetical protein